VHAVRQYKWYTYRSIHFFQEAVALFNFIGIVHYSQRSWEEQVRKIHGPRSSIQVKNSRTRLDINKPPGEYLEARDEMKFEKFRQIYRATMRARIPSPVLLPADEDLYDEQAFLG